MRRRKVGPPQPHIELLRGESSAAFNDFVGREISARRRALSMSRTNFAALLGVTPKRMRDLETGAARFTPAVFVRAAQILGFKPSEILQDLVAESTASLFSAEAGASLAAEPTDNAALRQRLEGVMERCEHILRMLDIIEADPSR